MSKIKKWLNSQYKEVISTVKKWLTGWYKSVEQQTKPVKILLYWTVLLFPYLILTILYVVLRWSDVKQTNILFWICIIFAATWFAFGPGLVQCFTREFKSLQTDSELPACVKRYFKQESDAHLTKFIHYRLREGALFNVVAIIPILWHPEILSKNLTYGYTDPFYWLIIIFLVWFLFYCANATAYVSLVVIRIIPDLKEEKILFYSPVIASHRYAMNKIRNLCGKGIKYICSALVFIPLAWYYILRQPEIVLESENKIQFQTSSSQPIGILIWVVSILVLYAFFLLWFMTSPYMSIRKYTKVKSDRYLLKAQEDFISQSRKQQGTRQAGNTITTTVYRYIEYLNLQEIRLLCKPDSIFDRKFIMVCFTSAISILSAVPGIQIIIECFF